MKVAKTQLRMMARVRGEMAVIAAAQGNRRDQVTDKELVEIQNLYKEALQTRNLTVCSVEELNQVLQPESLFEKFAYRKAHNLAGSKEFLAMKGQKFQVENQPTKPILRENKVIGFKCMHYSVTESAGTVKLTIIRKTPDIEITFGVRTREDSAKVGKDYDGIDNVITMKGKDTEREVEIKIHDDDEWNPDNDFYVELYDTKTKKRL